MLGRDRRGHGAGRDHTGPVRPVVAHPLSGSRRSGQGLGLGTGPGPVVGAGPGPLARGLIGLLLGAACGALALAVLPRREGPEVPPGSP